MAQQFPHQLKNPDQGYKLNEPAVYKLHFGNKYFIWKGKFLKGSIEQNMADIYKLRFRLPDPKHLFSPVAAYIGKARVLTAYVEVVIQTEDPQLLLRTERELLEAGRNDEACLNTVFEPHVPKWMQEQLDKVKEISVRELASNKSSNAVPGTRLKSIKSKSIPTSKEAITGTFIQKDDKVPDIIPVTSPEAVKGSTGKLSKLQSAFKKLNKS